MKYYHFTGWVIITLFIYGQSVVYGQNKKPLTHDAYEIWNQIKNPQISNNGQWMMYRKGPEDKDKTLIIKNPDSKKLYHFQRGDSAHFSDDSKFAVFLIRPPKDTLEQAKEAKKKPDEMPKDALGILNLQSGETDSIAKAKSYKMPEENGEWLAYQLEKIKQEKDSTTKKEGPQKKEKKSKDGDDKSEEKIEGTTLVLQNLASGEQSRFEKVVSYHFSKNGNWLVYAASSKDSTADGIYAVNLKEGKSSPILTGPGNYKQIAFDEAGKQLAFLTNRDSIEADQPSYSLYYWKVGQESAQKLVDENTSGMPEDWWIGEHGEVSFSKNGERIFFGSAPGPEPDTSDEESDELEVKLDIWHWQDPYLQPMQKKRVEKEKKRTYLATIEPDGDEMVQLGKEDILDVKVGDEGNAEVAIGLSNKPYRKLISWDWPPYYDIYLIDVNSGEAQPILQKLQARAKLSPNAEYLTWWDRNQLCWFSMDVKNKKKINLSAQIPPPVHNERHDWPFDPNPYGSPGWTENDKEFLLYDKHDLWAVNPKQSDSPRNVTDGLGKDKNLRFRYVQLDPEETEIKPNEPLLLSAFHWHDKREGFYRDQISRENPPRKLLMMERSFNKPKKAKEADALLFRQASFTEFPDLWISDLDFENMQKISDANPQQSEYRWGTAELIEWTSLDGKSLQGILYKPENFDFTKKYPMITYFYEKNSRNLYRHYAPAPHRSIINFTFYVSREYVIFVPDIPYQVGYPGESAYNAVIPGVTHLIEQGFVDKDNIGVQGHSWGGYQIAYLITRTDIFKAAEAGAPVSNMISAYGGIRWKSGMSRMFQYEHTQSRIGGSLWEYPLRYIENSPVFWADKVETPLLIMHNDNDGAVPWYQGIELFVALRRLGKKVWLINYSDQPHWPVKYENKRDWAIRLQQYFDHFLKDAPAPV